MKSFISSLILTGALWVSIPMSAQRPMNERVHDKVATKEAPRIQFVGKKQGPNLFQSAAASVTADFSCQSAGSAITVWEENFDDGTDGWTFTNAEDFSWTVKKITSTTDPSRDFSTYDPDDVQSLYIEGPYQSFKRGIATATSGQIDVPANAMLKGYIGFTQNMDDYCRLQISVSADALRLRKFFGIAPTRTERSRGVGMSFRFLWRNIPVGRFRFVLRMVPEKTIRSEPVVIWAISLSTV